MDLWSKATLKALFLPGGALLLAAVALLQDGFFPISTPAIDFYYYLAFIAGILLAWRFHSSRVIFALITLLLAHRALEFFSNGRIVATGPGHIAFEAVALLVPINFVAFAWIRERGLAVPAVVSRLALVFFESVFVAVICRPGETTGPPILRAALVDRHLFLWTRIPQPALLAFALASAALLIRFLLYRKPVDSGLLWSLAAVFAGLQFGGVGRVGSAYFATGGLILLASIIENSYVLAYQDELTALPSRRAFNDALLRLEGPYSVAAVDIDHFKSFNDTYGHDTGDQVLRMVGAKLARINGGGQAFRVGGEEFSILFPGKSLREALPHLKSLRVAIEESRFRTRNLPERRNVARGPDRRNESKRSVARRLTTYARDASKSAAGELSVTVSIGVAESNAKTREVETVIQAADKALYRAKHAGRNRVEVAGAQRPRGSRLKRNIA